MELFDDSWTDHFAAQKISVDTIITDPLIISVWLFYGFWDVDVVRHTAAGVLVSHCIGHCRNGDTWIWRVIVGDGQCYYEFGRGFCKGGCRDTIHKEFGNVKIGFDIFCVVFSLLLSVLFFDGRIQGCREGTIFAALCTGLVVKYSCRLIGRKVEAILQK